MHEIHSTPETASQFPQQAGDRIVVERTTASNHPAAQPAARIAWIDVARGIGIILVVLGHTLTLSIGGLSAKYVIFTFHMPLFVFLSALVLKPQDWQTVARTRMRPLLVPYLVYLALIGLPLTLWALHAGPRAAAEFAARLVLGGSFLVEALGAFWYIPTFFVSLVAYAALRDRMGGEAGRTFSIAMVAVLIVAYAVSAAAIAAPIPYCLQTVPAMMAFIWIGRRIPWPRLLSPRWVFAGLAVIVACIAFDMMTPTPSFGLDLKRGLLGAPILGILLAVAASQICFAISALLSRQNEIANVLILFGRNTLPLLFLHQPVHYGVVAAGINNQYLNAALGILVPCLFAWIVARALPRQAWLFGVTVPLRH